MKITDLKIGQFATRNLYNDSETLCVKKYSSGTYEYWENGQFSSIISNDSSIFNYTDFKLCDCNGKLIKEFTYPLFMESISDESVAGRVIKFDSLTSGTVVIQGNSTNRSGLRYGCLAHTLKEYWKPCDFSKAPDIEDLDYWDARHNAGLSVYFSFNGENNKTCYKANLLPSVLFKDNKNIKFHISDESKQEQKFTYPMYFECIKTHANEGMVVKFKTIAIGQIVKSGQKLGATKEFEIKSFTKHTCEKTWKQVDFDETIGKIIPDEDDIDELISDLKSIIEDDDNRFEPSERGAGTQLGNSGYNQGYDLIDKWMDKYHINKAPDVGGENFRHFDDLVDMIAYIENTILDNEFDEPIIGVDYESQPEISFVAQNGIKSRLHDDEFDALPYAKHIWETYNGAAKNVVNNLINQTKEFTMNNELKEAILELIATNGKPKVKKPKTPKIVCDVNGELMRFVDEAELKAFMWSSRVESVIRYDLAGKVTVPFELSVEAPKTKASK